MYEVLAFSTPNSVKVPIALEEIGVQYRLRAVNIRKGEHKQSEFFALNPNGKVPVLTFTEGDGRSAVITESAAILVFLAERHGQLLPKDGVERARVFEQLFFHASGISPAFGNAGYFQKLAPEKLPIAIDRFLGEANRLLGVLDEVLSRQPYVAGAAYSIADIAHFGWMWRRAFAGVTFDEYEHVARWFGEIAERPAVKRAIAKVEALAPPA